MDDPKMLHLEEITLISKNSSRITGLLSILLIAIGYYLSHIHFLQLEWLTRSGCLIVLLGLWSSIGGIIEERVVMSRLHIQHKIGLSKAKLKLRKVNAPQEYIKKEIESINEKFEDKINYIKEQARFHLGILEVSSIMAGTFLWGFGDLLLKIHL